MIRCSGGNTELSKLVWLSSRLYAKLKLWNVTDFLVLHNTVWTRIPSVRSAFQTLWSYSLLGLLSHCRHTWCLVHYSLLFCNIDWPQSIGITPTLALLSGYPKSVQKAPILHHMPQLPRYSVHYLHICCAIWPRLILGANDLSKMHLRCHMESPKILSYGANDIEALFHCTFGTFVLNSLYILLITSVTIFGGCS